MNYHCPDHPGPLDDARNHVCRLRPGPDPVDFESTSARLRRVEQDLDRVRAGRESAWRTAELFERQRDEALTRADLTEAELASARAELEHLRRERDQLRADLTEALNELQQLRGEAS